MGGRADVEVLWAAGRAAVAHAAADEIGDVFVLMQAVEDLERVGIDLFRESECAARSTMTGSLICLQIVGECAGSGYAPTWPHRGCADPDWRWRSTAWANEPPALAKARALYNAGDFEGAIDAASVARKDAEWADAAALVVARAHLEHFRSRSRCRRSDGGARRTRRRASTC